MTHSQEETHTVTFILPLAQRKPNKATPTCLERGERERTEPAGIFGVLTQEKGKKTNKKQRTNWKRCERERRNRVGEERRDLSSKKPKATITGTFEFP